MMFRYVELPWVVVRFQGAVAGAFPSRDAAVRYRDGHCRGGTVRVAWNDATPTVDKRKLTEQKGF